jgi:hypothetical protein
VVKAWNMMGGLNWSALPIVAEIIGIQDLEYLVVQLNTIKQHQSRSA